RCASDVARVAHLSLRAMLEAEAAQHEGLNSALLKFAVQSSLCEALRELGVTPSCVFGRGDGVPAAAVALGSVNAEAAIRLALSEGDRNDAIAPDDGAREEIARRKNVVVLHIGDGAAPEGTDESRRVYVLRAADSSPISRFADCCARLYSLGVSITWSARL